MNRRHGNEEDRGVRRPPEKDDPASKEHVARPEEWQALQRALGNRAFEELLQRQQRQRTQQKALDEAPLLISPGMQSRISKEAGRGKAPGGIGADSVRIHEGPDAESLAADLGAKAFTQGQDIFLGAGGRDPLTLTHELTHAAAGTAGLGSVQRKGLDEEEEEIIIVDDDIIDPTETMDPFAGQSDDEVTVIDESETMDPFEGQGSGSRESIDPSETLDPFKEEGKGRKSADADAGSLGLEADYKTTSAVGEDFARRVLTPVQEAFSFTQGGAGNAQQVYDNLVRAKAAMLEIIKSAEASEVLSEQFATAYNMLVAIQAMLEPHVGIDRSFDSIERNLGQAVSGFEGVMKRLDMESTVE